MGLLNVILVALLVVSVVECVTYEVTSKRLNNNQPILTSQTPKQSIFEYNYNVAYLPLFFDGVVKDAILVRCQNSTVNEYTVSPSKLSVSFIANPIDFSDFKCSDITSASIIFQPDGPSEEYGTEDPRIVWRELDRTYYLLYSAVSSNPITAKLALATTTQPLNVSSWIRHGPLFPDLPWSKSGSLLIRDGYPGPHYLFWGDSSSVCGLTVAVSDNLLNWTNLNGTFLQCRENSFDVALVEAGPMPLLLADGNYLLIYNSARHGFPSVKPNWDMQYNIGWAVLNGSNPLQILQRCDSPLLSPVYAWENGTEPYLGLTPNVVFLEGWMNGPYSNSFIGYYGAADSVVGAVAISVEIVN